MSSIVPSTKSYIDVHIDELNKLMPLIWCRESSGFPQEWTEDNPSCGQCHPTTRLVRALYGGVIITQTLKPAFVKPSEPKFWGHCVNEINGYRYDLTSDQLKCEVYSVVREQIWPVEEIIQFDAEWPGMKQMILALFVAYESQTGVRLAVR
jgi:hypothetical protein